MMAEVFEQRELLPTEEWLRFDDQILAASEHLKTVGIQHQQIASLPIGQPDPIPKKTWRKKKAHGRGNARALTAAEVAERDLRAQERRDKKQRVHTLDGVQEGGEEEIQIPATPEQLLPASTAPARLVGGQGTEGRAQGKRKMTEAYREARQAGLQSLGYSQVEE